MARARPQLQPSHHAHQGSPGCGRLFMVGSICLGVGYFLGTSSSLLATMTAGSTSSRARAGAVSSGSAASSSSGAEEVQNSSSTGAASSGGGPGTARVKSVCEDSCPGRTNNGVCDEGRATLKAEAQPDRLTIFSIFCDLGTDCGDCGPWAHNNSDASDSWRPIQEIIAKNFTVMSRQTAHPAHFFMAFTDPAQDVDVSSQLVHNVLLEPGFTWIWHYVLRDGCTAVAGQGGSQQPPLVLDVGANFGYYSLLAAAMGCRVIAWEPVPYFSAYFKYGLLRNNFTNAVELRDSLVSNTSGIELSIEVPNRGIWGTAGIGGKNIDRAIANSGDYDNFTRKVERLDEEVQQDVLVLKVDVEGFEANVLFGSKNLLLQHNVRHIFMEYSPGVAERHTEWPWFLSNPIMLLGLLQGGYRILHMGTMSQDYPIWEGKELLPELEEVTREVLKHDIWDAWRLMNTKLGCLNKTAKAQLQVLRAEGKGKGDMFGCMSIPEGLDPHSFRATFGHNTNLWAFKDKKPWFARIGSPASLAPLDFDVQHEFFVLGGVVGVARRLCSNLAPAVQVMHRCPCMDKEVCGELEEKVKELAWQGLLPPFPLEEDSVQPDKMGIETW